MMIFFFHIIFRRELAGAYRVRKEYDFLKVSGLKEVQLSYKSENHFFLMIYYYLNLKILQLKMWHLIVYATIITF